MLESSYPFKSLDEAGILGDRRMGEKLISIPNDDKKNYFFFRSKLLQTTY